MSFTIRPQIDHVSFSLFCLRKKAHEIREALTPAEGKVYNMLLAGFNLKQIAKRTGKRLDTTQNYASTCIRKGYTT